ncbi:MULTISPECIES: thymidine kinase [unclassified Diaphorobacter]|uniref:thymidine kinase n=1 Tax=unclassified Diaphorobacter TaxID=2649760 RepID=UPI0006996560|nr:MULTISPECIES: thymidine kinase [unclassified Diaphorobacter]POR10780.1 hypothetical protein BV908_08580 [Diaphorobacter sp. LR2014-1]
MQGQSIGSLEFFYSTMQGGKSTALLQYRYNLLAIGKTVRVMTSASDDRFGTGRITSRMGVFCDAEVFSENTVFKRTAFEGVDELFIDEAQFLTPTQVRQLHQDLRAKGGMRVSCFGLRTDFQGNPFPGAAMLLALADDLHAISTLCRCGEKATMNLRIEADGKPVRMGDVLEIGGDTRYKPVCPRCFY